MSSIMAFHLEYDLPTVGQGEKARTFSPHYSSLFCSRNCIVGDNRTYETPFSALVTKLPICHIMDGFNHHPFPIGDGRSHQDSVACLPILVGGSGLRMSFGVVSPIDYNHLGLKQAVFLGCYSVLK